MSFNKSETAYMRFAHTIHAAMLTNARFGSETNGCRPFPTIAKILIPSYRIGQPDHHYPYRPRPNA